MERSRHQRTAEFLADAFTQRELLRLADEVGGPELMSWLLPNAPLAETSHEIVNALARRGLLERLDLALRERRPARGHDIDKLQLTPSVETPHRLPIVLVWGLAAGEAMWLEEIVKRTDPLQPVEKLATSQLAQTPRTWEPAIVGVLIDEFMVDSNSPLLISIAEQHRLGIIRAVPIIVQPCAWRDTPLAAIAALPTGGEPIRSSASSNLDSQLGAYQALQAVARHLMHLAGSASVPTVRASPLPGPHAEPTSPPPRRPIDRIFRTTGVPDINFVAPSQLPELAARIGMMDVGLVVEGPSGTGKTTATQRALEQRLGAALDDLISANKVSWLSAKDPAAVDRLRTTLASGHRALEGHLVIDDFHRLPRVLQAQVADSMKLIADAGAGKSKITVIGINPVGSSLVRDFPDLAGRFAIVSMNRQPDATVLELILKGEQAANVVFVRRDDFVAAARGSLFTVQLLCLEAAIRAGIVETAETTQVVPLGPDGPVADSVLAQLRLKYQEPLRDFASYDLTPPPRGATLYLLWLLAVSPDATVSLAQGRARYPHLAAAFDWLMASHLAGGFAAHARWQELFFYNRDGGILSMEDPQLDFYLRNLSWPALARDSGHQGHDWAPESGFTPIISATSEPQTPPRAASTSPPMPRSRVLHLSDLHMKNQEDAILWYSQLLADLRGELRYDRLDAVIVSGDLTHRASAGEFDAAKAFLADLRRDFKLDPSSIVLVPGNHDVSWEASKKAWKVQRREDCTDLDAQTVIDKGEFVEVRDDAAWQLRFRNFASFYYDVRIEPYPLDYEYQATIHHFSEARLLVLGLNSSWRIDYARGGHTGIHDVALGRALQRILLEPAYDNCLKIAVWHHPTHGPDDDRIRDTGFLERLTQAGFRLGLHGHLHNPQADAHHHDIHPQGRRLDILGAGTFGAPYQIGQPGTPLQYQILDVEGDRVRVHTRRREDPTGAWKPDARWTVTPGEIAHAWYDLII